MPATHAFVVLGSAITTAATPMQWGSYQQGGTTKLLGTALGLISKDVTYDDAVRT